MQEVERLILFASTCSLKSRKLQWYWASGVFWWCEGVAVFLAQVSRSWSWSLVLFV